MRNKKYYLPALGIVNALGCGLEEVSQGLFSGDTSGLILEHDWLIEGAARVGRVKCDLPEIPAVLSKYSCHNNRLLLGALVQIESVVEAAITKYGHNRVGVVLGTSTSGIAESERTTDDALKEEGQQAEHHYLFHEQGLPAIFLAEYLGLKGPAYSVSTACTSSAKAFQSARNLLQYNFCDVVLVGDVDSLCQTTVNGFSSLESISKDISNPMSRYRNGINIGEGAALFLMTKEEANFALFGVGESSDAYHISAPHPEGRGAEVAMRAALADANKKATDIHYLNLHATATIKNDEMESRAVNRVFPNQVPCSGTKPLTGHTLGAAGATELAFSWIALQNNLLPAHVWDGEEDLSLPQLDLISTPHSFNRTTSRLCMSNSFAFGGSNVSLIIGDNQ